jgi:hypothetical protein
LAPLALAPADVPVWLVAGVAAAVGVGGRWAPVAVVVQLALGAVGLVHRTRTVRAETAIVAEIAADLGPDDGVIAPWTWGARVAVAASADPYGIRWRPPRGFLRDQRDPWCRDLPDRVVFLPPGAPPTAVDEGCR